MIVLDASVVIAHLDDDDAHHRQASDLLLTNAGDSFGCSVITIAEVLVGPQRRGAIEQALGQLQILGITEVELGAKASRRLAELRASTGRRFPDCCVLLATLDSGAAVATFDDALAAAARRLGIELVSAHSG